MNMKRGAPPSIEEGDHETLDSTLPNNNSHTPSNYNTTTTNNPNNQDKKRMRTDTNNNDNNNIRSDNDIHSRFQYPSSSSRNDNFHGGPLLNGGGGGGGGGLMNNTGARSGPTVMGDDRRGPPQMTSPRRNNNNFGSHSSNSGGGGNGNGGRNHWNNNNKQFDDFSRVSQPPPSYDEYRGNNNNNYSSGNGNTNGPLPPYGDAEPYVQRGGDGGGLGGRSTSPPAQHDQFGRQIPQNHRSASSGGGSGSGGGGGLPSNHNFVRGDRHVANFQGTGVGSVLNRPHFDERVVGNAGRQTPSSDRNQEGYGRSGSGGDSIAGVTGGSSTMSSSSKSEFAKVRPTMQQLRPRDAALNNNAREGASFTKPGEVKKDESKETERNPLDTAAGLLKKSKVATDPRALPRAETPPPQEVPVVDVVPLSPPAAPPSALALAMARLTDLTAQMEFQYAKHLQLSREHEIVKTKLTVLQGLPVGIDAFREDLQKLTAEKIGEECTKVDSATNLIAKIP